MMIAKRAAFRTLAMTALGTLMLAVSWSPRSQAAGSRLPLHVVASVPLTGRPTRWDYASLDPSSHRLYLAHLGDSEVVAFDTRTRKVVAHAAGVSTVHGVLFVPAVDTLYASATGTNQVVAIDPKTMKITARVPAGTYPDGMAYAPEVHRLYVSDEHGDTETVIDVRTKRRIKTIALGGDVGNSQYDPISKHIFVNVQTRDELVEIDPVTDTVISRTKLPGAEGNHGLYIDPTSHLAFIACEGNNKLIVLDLSNRRVEATFDVARDPDVLAFDRALSWLYVAGESGQVSIFHVRGHTVAPLGTAYFRPNAHVVAVDQQSHRAYFPIASLGGRPRLIITEPEQHADGSPPAPHRTPSH